MRKLLLTFFSILCVSLLVKAETYSFTAEQMFSSATANTNPTEWTCQGINFNALKNAGGTAPTFIFNAKDLRLYAKNTLQITVSGCNITSISFELSAQGLKRYAEFTPSVGSLAEPGANPLVWNGSANDITFTVGDKAIYGTDGDSKAGQFDIQSITITTDGPTGEATPLYGTYAKVTEMSEGSYLIFAENSIAGTPTKTYGYLPVEPVTLQADGKITTALANAWEFITVEGGYNIKDPNGRYMYQAGTFNSFNFSETIDEEIAACYVWTVTPEDGLMKIFNTVVEKTMQYDTTYGSFGLYPDTRGVFPALYKFEQYAEEPGEEPVIPSVTALSQVYDMANGDKFTMDTDLTVVYANGSYVFVFDGTNYGLVYMSLSLQPGDKIAKGWTGSIKIYAKLFELIPDAALVAEGIGELPAPERINAENAAVQLISANQNRYVHLIDVTFAEAPSSNNFTGTMGEGENVVTVNFYQRFGVEVEAGTFDVIGFISVYNSTVQVLPTQIISKTESISGINTDLNAPATYYNIQGVKVQNPREGGFYIRVQGGKATKVVF